jgi:hypothetical protein
MRHGEWVLILSVAAQRTDTAVSFPTSQQTPLPVAAV